MSQKSSSPQSARRSRRSAERIGKLSRLPLFLRLKGRRVVLAGGSEAACWKAELLLAAEARIDLYATELDDEWSDLLQRGDGDGQISHHARPWGIDVFEGAALAVCDAESMAEAHAFRCAGRAAGVPINVIDKPAFCDVQFSTIVNRDPVTVAISTDGAAPVLGQELRRRIEAILPFGLGLWAAAGKRMRERVLEAFPEFTQRRGFWQRFTDQAMTREPGDDLEADIQALIARTKAANDKGHVTLVGAGPGDAEHLTLKAFRALQAADVILHDDLIEPGVLELARREAKRVMVGKRGGGRPSCKQDDINAMMVRLALSGKRIVRLKSGDPMIFGRAGEEIAELDKAGISFDVVPGVTAAFGAAARLGVTLTHRDFAQSVRFVTGHGKTGTLPADLDWKGLADPRCTLIIYMGGRTAGRLATRLIDEGLASDTPVALVEAATKPDERRLATTLEALSEGDLAPEGPLLIGIGRVFGLRQSAWAEGYQANALLVDAATQDLEPKATAV